MSAAARIPERPAAVVRAAVVAAAVAPAAGRRPWLVPVLMLACLVFDATVARGANTIRSIRHWTAPDHTRVVVDCSTAPTLDDFTLTDPDRIVVNVSGARFQRGLAPIRVGDGMVARVRLNSLRRGIAQVVLDLDREREYRIFVLPPSHGRPDRIVIDVLRPEPRATAERREREIASLKERRTIIVMVDPGHGGEDPGALGPGGVKEKIICLDLARALRDEINRRRGFKAFLTRDGDYFVSLRRRTQLARQHQADYFVSVHTNAHRSRDVHGTEVYFLSLRGASDQGARDVAQRENAADRMSGVPRESRDVVEEILKDLMHTAAMERSSHMAGCVIDRLRKGSKLTIRGVKQAGFDVLKTAGMPSILVETAFITHRQESKLLRSKRFQRRFARLLADGLVDHARLDAGSVQPGD